MACVQVLFFPSGSAVTCYDLGSGQKCTDMRGHLATVNAAAWSPRLCALITGSTDKQLLLSGVSACSGDVCAGGDAAADDGSEGDRWSDDDDAAAVRLDAPPDREGGGGGALFSGGRRTVTEAAAHAGTGRELQAEAERGLSDRQRRRGGQRGRGGPGRGGLGAAGGVAVDRRAQQDSARITRIATQLVRRLVRHAPQSDKTT